MSQVRLSTHDPGWSGKRLVTFMVLSLLVPPGANTLAQELGIWCLVAFSAESLETSVR